MRLAVLAVVALVAATGCGGAEDAATPPPTTTVAESGPAPAREAAPLLSGESLDGRAIALADFRTKPVLINVWSSW